MAHTAQQGDLVLLEPHPGAAAEAEPPPGQLTLHLFHREGQACGQSLDHHHQGATVRLAGGEEAEHRESMYLRTPADTVD